MREKSFVGSAADVNFTNILHAFLVQKCFVQLFSNYRLALFKGFVIFCGKNIGTRANDIEIKKLKIRIMMN